MKNPNLYLPGFHLATLRRKPRSARQKLADKLSKIRRKSMGQLAKCFTDLYFQRWDIELFFRDIKTTMGMDILRCKSPSMIRKELLMHFIVYNCLRLLMLKAADKANVPVREISFKASVQALRQWEPLLKSELSTREQYRLLSLLCESIAASVVNIRSGRREPRCRKRRPKNYQLMTKPRHEMQEIRHRSKYCAAGA